MTTDERAMLVKDELIGLHTTIKECSDNSVTGTSGKIVDETKNTFRIKVNDKEKTIVKKNALFEFEYNGEKILIDGYKLTYRPEDRIKKSGGKIR
ncbi:ribonuclease P protein subunit [bacterium]|nr:ribonuclease P protein subunit [bacterium]